MLTRLAHIGIAVKDAESTLRLLVESLGGRVAKRKSAPWMGLDITLFELAGISLELLQPTGEGPIARFLEKRGPGIHHLAFEVDDMEEAVSRCREKGIKLIDESPRKGALAPKIAFLDPRSTGRILIELCQHTGGESSPDKPDAQ